MVVGNGTTSTELSTGCFELPDQDEEESASVEFLMPRLKEAGMGMVRTVDRPLITNIGTLRSCEYAGKATSGPIEKDGLAILGVLGDPDLDPDLVSSMLSSSGKMTSYPYWTSVSIDKERTDLAPLDVYMTYGRDLLVDALVDRISDVSEDMVMVPPLFPLSDHIAALENIERRSGRSVFEAMTPMSLPGRRLQKALERTCALSGCKMMLGRDIDHIEIENGVATKAKILSGDREGEVTFSAVVLATGEHMLSSGRMIMTSDPRYPFGLEIEEAMGVDRPCSRSLRAALSIGYRTDIKKRTSTRNGRVVENMFATGACLAGASFACGGGLGTAIENAWELGQIVLEVE